MSDLPLSDGLYQSLRDLLLDRLGLHYPPNRRGDLARALSLAAQELGYSELGQIYTALLTGGPAWDVSIRHLTIGETYFFRNGAQFAALRERILPDLLARRAGTRSLRVWSAGCASGEEPYSLAMVLADILPADAGWQVSILGTDLNPDFLSRAREALYGPWSFRDTPDALRDRFFVPEGARWRLRQEIRRSVIFGRLNLAADGYPALTNGTTAMDLIFCRNVLIYFDAATTRAIIGRLYDALAPGGWLVVGHAEPNAEIFQRFETVNAPGTVLYRKPFDAPFFLVNTRRSAPAARGSETASPASESQWRRPAPAAARPAAAPATPTSAPIPAPPLTHPLTIWPMPGLPPTPAAGSAPPIWSIACCAPRRCRPAPTFCAARSMSTSASPIWPLPPIGVASTSTPAW